MKVDDSASRPVTLAVLAAALGYFVDAYDLVLYNIVRVPSLKALGVSGHALLTTGVDLLNLQLAGMLLGGVLWGVWGDKLGRRSVLFGSIVTYSLATLINGWVNSIAAYGACRFLAGIGLAGELGAGVTLVAELLSPRLRGYGTMIIAAVGVVGVCVASLVGDHLGFRQSYFVGGALGLGLLGLRLGVRESALFASVQQQTVPRGNLMLIIANPRRLLRYLRLIVVALPIWCAISVFVTFAPELGRDMGLANPPSAAKAVFFYYVGLTLGDLCSGYLSQRFRNRRQVIFLFMSLFALGLAGYPMLAKRSLNLHYAAIFWLGFASGYWAVFITMAAELFGTNLRATVAISAPNLVRGLAVPFTLLFRGFAGDLGARHTALLLGSVALILGAGCLYGLQETYGRSLDFLER
jgi:MFS transporter, putative metabolite:H+ symporter